MPEKNKEELIPFKHPLVKLEEYFKDRPGFVVGNGYSKTYFDFDILKSIGVIIGCNEAFELHHVDLTVCQDVDKRGLFFKVMKSNSYKIFPKIIRKSWQRPLALAYEDEIFYYDTRRSWREYNGVRRGLSGYLAFQVAYKIGCNPIILVGMDCCAEGGRLNAHDRPHKVKYKIRNKWTNKTLKESIDRLMELYDDIKEERRVFKLGDYGVLSIPIISLEAVLNRNFEVNTYGAAFNV